MHESDASSDISTRTVKSTLELKIVQIHLYRIISAAHTTHLPPESLMES
jgi:hypothetical protein